MLKTLGVLLVLATAVQAGELEWFLLKGNKDIQFGGLIDEMHSIRLIQDGEADLRVIYGDRLGQIHSVRSKEGRFQEEWVSPNLRGPISEVFIADVNDDEQIEIVAYTELGEIVIFRASDYRELWRSTDDEFKTISGMVVENVDDDPQLEMVFTAESASDIASYQPIRGGSSGDQEIVRANQIARLYVYDCLNLFMEWSSEQGLSAESICVADFDDDGILEIALSTGFVVDAAFQRVEWHWPDGFGQRIGYADLDGDDIPELIGEYRSSTRPRRSIRVFDVDLQSENFLSAER